MKHMESDAFVRLIAYQHTVGTMEYIATRMPKMEAASGLRSRHQTRRLSS